MKDTLTYEDIKKLLCAAYQCMLDFDVAFSDIPKQYFDLWIDEENQHNISDIKSNGEN